MRSDPSLPAWKARATQDSPDRRGARRIEILGRLHGHIVSLDVDVDLREIGLGGLSMESAVPFPEDAVHEFRIAMGDGTPVVVQGQVVYCRLLPGTSGRRYLTGVRFLDDEDDSAVENLIETLE